MKALIDKIKQIWSIEELRNRIILTLSLVLVYRIGSFIVLPGVDPDKIQDADGIFNLINIFAACENKMPEIIAEKYQNSGFGDFKKDFSESLINKITPIQQNIKDLNNNLDYVATILKQGQEQASEIAARNIIKIKKIIGLA